MLRALLAARIEELVDSGELPAFDTARTAETMLRLAYTVVLQPYGLVPGKSPEEIRAFARTFMVPMFRRPAA